VCIHGCEYVYAITEDLSSEEGDDTNEQLTARNSENVMYVFILCFVVYTPLLFAPPLFHCLMLLICIHLHTDWQERLVSFNAPLKETS